MPLSRISSKEPVPEATSRNITACAACRKQKIKCRLTDSKPPCMRCRRRGLSCIMRKTPATLIEIDVSWKDSIEARLQHMESKINASAQVSTAEQAGQSASQVHTLDENALTDEQGQVAPLSSGENVPSLQSWEVVMDQHDGPGAIPASCISKATISLPASRQEPDISHSPAIVSQGTLSLAAAERYFDLYHQQLDPAVYNILADHNSFASVCASSSLLLTVICTVAALHCASSDYQLCYQAFRDEFSAQQLRKEYSFDDVRALCIGAFYLSDLSWTLVGAAVRIATEINLHRCITKIPHVKEKCYVRTRLYFLVYICDHHFSVAYGRPPMTREFTSLSSPKAFLDSSFATHKDVRLISQVEIWSINGRIFDTFGVDTEMAVSDKLLPQIRRLNIALDTWRADWSDRLSSLEDNNKHLQTDIALHFHFAKLYLCSHVFRGTWPETEQYAISTNMDEFASLAVHSACSIIRLVNTDEQIHLLLRNLPTYFDTMLAFAAVFLLKLARKCPINVKVSKREIWDLVDQLVTGLKTVITEMHEQHLLYNIATSIESLLQVTRQPAATSSQLTGMTDAAGNLDWLMPSSDSIFLDHYDFFWPQDNDLDFEFSGSSNVLPSVS